MRVHFTNLGCKLNQAELERLAREFHRAGHEVVASLEEAELHVVNIVHRHPPGGAGLAQDRPPGRAARSRACAPC